MLEAQHLVVSEASRCSVTVHDQRHAAKLWDADGLDFFMAGGGELLSRRKLLGFKQSYLEV